MGWDNYDSNDWAVQKNGKSSFYIMAKLGTIYKVIGEPQ